MKNILRNDEPPQHLALTEDLEMPGEWLVEYSDDDGADNLTIFAGQEAEARLRDYRDALKEGRLGTRTRTAGLEPAHLRPCSLLRYDEVGCL